LQLQEILPFPWSQNFRCTSQTLTPVQTSIYMKHILRLQKWILMRPLDLVVFLGLNVLYKYLYKAYYKTLGGSQPVKTIYVIWRL
jgi:hypothetical protein